MEKPIAYWPYEVAFIRSGEGKDLSTEEGESLFRALPDQVKDNKIAILYSDGKVVMFSDCQYRIADCADLWSRRDGSHTLPVPHDIPKR